MLAMSVVPTKEAEEFGLRCESKIWSDYFCTSLSMIDFITSTLLTAESWFWMARSENITGKQSFLHRYVDGYIL